MVKYNACRKGVKKRSTTIALIQKLAKHIQKEKEILGEIAFLVLCYTDTFHIRKLP